MIQIDDLKLAIKFVGPNLQKMEDNAKRYGLPLEQVKSVFIQTMKDALDKEKLSKSTDVKYAIKQLSREALREQWYAFTKTCHDLSLGQKATEQKPETKPTRQPKPAPKTEQQVKTEKEKRANPKAEKSVENTGKKIGLDDVEHAIVFKDSTLTKVESIAEEYKIKLDKVKELFIRSMYNTIYNADAQDQETARDVIKRFTKDDWKKQWRRFIQSVEQVAGVNRGKDINGEDVKNAIDFNYPATVTKLKNVCQRYDMDKDTVQEFYARSMYLTVKELQPTEEETARMVIARFEKEGWSRQWRIFMDLIQTAYGDKDPESKKEMDKVKAKVLQIIKNDKLKANLAAKKLKKQMEDADPGLQIGMKKELELYEAYLKNVDAPQSVNHFINRYLEDRDLTTFIFMKRKK